MSFLAFILTSLRKTFAPWTYWLPYLGKRALKYWTFWVPRRAQAPRKRLSTAQRCNDDVLEEILLLLPRPTLASAARVCRDWLPSARRNLYRALDFDSTSPSAHTLAQALSSSSYLRDIIHRPTVFHMASYDVSTLRWLALLPEHSLQSITFLGQILDFPDSDSILNLPAIRTTTHIISRAPPSLPSLLTLLNMTQLVSLSVNFRSHVLPPTDIALPNLKRLSIIVSNYTSSVDVLLKGLSQPLVRFDLQTLDPLEEEDIFALRDGLLPHAPHLQHLSFEGDPFVCREPFVDDYIVTFTSLRTLFCGDVSYTPRIFSQIPSNLESLTLHAPMSGSFPDAAFAEALKQHQNRLTALRRVSVMEYRIHRVSCNALEETCRTKSIDFTTVTSKEDNYFFS